MKRIILAIALCLVLSAPAAAGDAAAKKTIAYVQKLQTSGGGFVTMMAPNIRVQPTLKATSSAVRALHYLGGDIPDKAACIKFVESCHDPESGGFRDTPTGKPDVFTTAVGIMAVTELKMPTEKYAKGAIKYLSDNAKSFEDIRIAAAGLERLNMKSPKNDEWHAQVLFALAAAQLDKSPGKARDLASCEVTRLRLGGKLADAEAILKDLKAGQRQNGGYGKKDDASASDLETTYRVMRCFVMLKSKPGNVDGVRSFVAKCRNEDGGYGVAPGQPSSVGGAYFASIILHWLKN
jgi:prenyltransferase beta subunit